MPDAAKRWSGVGGRGVAVSTESKWSRSFVFVTSRCGKYLVVSFAKIIIKFQATQRLK